MRWVAQRQQERDHAGMRNVCAGCGHEDTDADPLTVADDGMRVHRRHTTDSRSGYYGAEQSSRR